MYTCYDFEQGSCPINSKNYKYKHGFPSLLPLVILRLFSYVEIPNKLKFYQRAIDVTQELEAVDELNLSNYKTMLNSDLTILIGVALMKNKKLQVLHLSDLNLYDIDIKTLISNIPSLSHLRKLSFKRTTFMDKISGFDNLLSDKSLPNMTELSFNMTNLLV